MRGLTNRQPSVLSWTVTSPRGNASRALGITSGARDIDSTPPAITRSASPTAIARAPSMTACRPEPHSRLTVAPGTRDRQAGEQQAHARDVAVVLAGLVRAAEEHVVDAGGIGAGAPHELGDRDRAQIVGAHLGQRAAEPPDRRPNRVDDQHVTQVIRP